MQENKVRQLTYGAVTAVLFAVLMLLSNVPLLLIVTTWFVPLPIAIYASKFGLKNSIIVSIVGVLLVLLTAGILSAFMAIFFAIIGMTLSVNVKKNRSKIETLLAVSTASILMIAATIYGYILFTGVNIVDYAIKFSKETINEQVEVSNKLAESLGQKPAMTQEQADLAIKSITETLPASVILSAFGLGLLIIVLNFPLMKRFGIPVQKFNALKDLRLPKILLFAYFIVIGLKLFIQPEDSTYMYSIIVNASLILSVLFFIQGVSFIHFMVARSNLPKPVAWIATILAFPLNSFVLLLGIIDLGIELRTLLGDKPKK